MSRVQTLLNLELVTLGNAPITVGSLFVAVLIIDPPVLERLGPRPAVMEVS